MTVVPQRRDAAPATPFIFTVVFENAEGRAPSAHAIRRTLESAFEVDFPGTRVTAAEENPPH